MTLSLVPSVGDYNARSLVHAHSVTAPHYLLRWVGLINGCVNWKSYYDCYYHSAMFIIIPIGLIIRLITTCVDACYEKAAERRARREEERLAAEEERAQAASPAHSESDSEDETSESAPFVDK